MKKLKIPSEKDPPKVVVKETDKSKNVSTTVALNKIADKLDTLNNSIANKPSSFEFDVIRDTKGYINKVYVKPINQT